MLLLRCSFSFLPTAFWVEFGCCMISQWKRQISQFISSFMFLLFAICAHSICYTISSVHFLYVICSTSCCIRLKPTQPELICCIWCEKSLGRLFIDHRYIWTFCSLCCVYDAVFCVRRYRTIVSHQSWNGTAKMQTHRAKHKHTRHSSSMFWMNWSRKSCGVSRWF